MKSYLVVVIGVITGMAFSYITIRDDKKSPGHAVSKKRIPIIEKIPIPIPTHISDIQLPAGFKITATP